MKTWGNGEAVDHNDLNGNFSAVRAQYLALGATGGADMKAWTKGEPVTHDDLNTNFNLLSGLAAQLASGTGTVLVPGGPPTGSAGGIATLTNHVLRRNGSPVVMRDGTYLTFR